MPSTNVALVPILVASGGFYCFTKFNASEKLPAITHCSYEVSVSQIKSLIVTAHGYCAQLQVELQFRPKLTSSTHKSFKIPVKK